MEYFVVWASSHKQTDYATEYQIFYQWLDFPQGSQGYDIENW